MKATDLFYAVKPLVPRRVQIALRRRLAARQRIASAAVWPIDEESKAPPPGWRGWPEGKTFAFVLTHDVEKERGVQRCRFLMRLEEELGFRSAFNFVPERYAPQPQLRRELKLRGFEVGVHGLNHDGRLYRSKALFMERAARINHYLEEWGATGFRSPSMQHNLDWLHALNIRYDESTFDVDPFEPQSDGVHTIFPFIVPPRSTAGQPYVELPYTLPQDFTLFVILGEKDPSIWIRKLDWIAEHGGMALVNVHPDYLCPASERPSLEDFPASIYRDFLSYAKTRYGHAYWHAKPCDVADWVARKGGTA